MKVRVEKYTGIEALRKANSFTSGKKSEMHLSKAYALGHSPIRTQRFYIFLEDIPLFVASQLVRSHVGVQWYQKSKRTDRGGEDFDSALDVITDDIKEKIKHITPDEIGQYLAEVGLNINLLRDRFDRYAPTSLMADLNAESFINISRKRLCATASAETRMIWEQVIEELRKVDPALASHCVKPCIASGGVCRESRC